MNTCTKYDQLPEQARDALLDTIYKRVIGKSNVADIFIQESDRKDYDFYIEVWKYNSRSGWSTRAYAKSKGLDTWRICFNRKNAGRTAKYN
jgi:hypothetical protein